MLAAVIAGSWAAAHRPSLTVAVIAAIALGIVAYRSPKRALIVVLLTLLFIPPWFGIDKLGFIPVATGINLLALLCNWGSVRLYPRRADLPLLIFITISAIGVGLLGSPQGLWIQSLTMWVSSYMVGKSLIRTVGVDYFTGLFGKLMSAIGLLAFLEFAFDIHPFENLAWDTSLYSIWGPIQERGGFFRSEWAFGHSIALGACLALAIPFVIQARSRTFTKIVQLICILAGTVVTFSRGAILAAILTFALTILFGAHINARTRVSAFIFGALGIAAVVGPLGTVFDDASGEADASSDYRFRILDVLLPTIRAVGPSSRMSTDGTLNFGYTSIDNAYLLVALSFGALAAVGLFVPLIVFVARMLRRRATSFELAIIGQIPVLFTVAMITQYQMILWLVAGGAAYTVAIRRARTSRSALPQPTAVYKHP